MALSAAVRNYSNIKNLKLVAFDLDGTIWTPDMYELWGGGAPFKVAKNGKDLVDCTGRPVRLLGISGEVLHELKHDPNLAGVKVAWASRTDEPQWAEECMRLFTTVPGNEPLVAAIDASEIHKGNKQKHFQNLKAKFPEIEYSEMLFFDNEFGNIRDVSKLGVKCVYCQDGVTARAWEEGLDLFR